MLGNSILRGCHLAHYTHNSAAAEIGAVGSISNFFYFYITSFPCHYLLNCNHATTVRFLGALTCVIIGALDGAVGSVILIRQAGSDLGGINISHATTAGVLGGAIHTLIAWIYIMLTLSCRGPIRWPPQIMTFYEWLRVQEEALESEQDGDPADTCFCTEIFEDLEDLGLV